MSQRQEWDSQDLGRYGRESERQSWGSEGGGYGSYGNDNRSSARRSESYGPERYREGLEEPTYGYRREFDEGPRYGARREESYPRNYWNPEPQYGREGRYSGPFGGRSSMESGRQGFPQSGQGYSRDAWRGSEGERWDRSGSEWSGRSQDDSRFGQRSTTLGGARTQRGPKGYKRSDERIREDVCDRLSDTDLNCEEVEVNVKNGEVILTGSTDSGHVRREIERLTENISGVKDVTNQIRIRRDNSSTSSPESKTSSSASSDASTTRRETVKVT